ncbi:Putative ABC-type amino acid transport/signal transduction systems (fragment)（Extracellular solute-binding protein, family 3,25-241&|uniref:substrate-binding periplasmic protein n=1 Tax=Magnetospirillum sp. XM-1 TaxID=1663591 RepID=UPI00073DF9B3
MGRWISAFLLVLGAALPAEAVDVSVAIGHSKSPYVFPDEERGIEFDIVKEALALEGHRMIPAFLPMTRVLKALEKGQVAAAMTQQPGIVPGAAYSDTYITYHNFAISLDANAIALSEVSDLGGKSVVAFQNATLVLGPNYRKVAESNPRYLEEANQMAQPLLLYLGRTDVIIADPNIFGWYAGRPEVRSKVDTTQKLRYAPLFPPIDYRMAFRDPALRDAFNRGLAKLRASGAYDRIIAGYADQMVTRPSAGSR